MIGAPEDPPDIVIGADTIVVLPGPSSVILEKPRNVLDQIQMLEDCNGSTVKIITAITLGEFLSSLLQSEALLIFHFRSSTSNRCPWVLARFFNHGDQSDVCGQLARTDSSLRRFKGRYASCSTFILSILLVLTIHFEYE